MKLGARLGLCITLWLLITSAPAVNAQRQSEDGGRLEAAFVYNFAKLTRWPGGAGGADNAPFTLCTLGEDDVIGPLSLLGGRLIQGHTVSVQMLTGRHIPRDCHVLYVASSEDADVNAIVAAARGEPILTVSKLPRFAHSGGIIELYREDGRIRFRINLAQARGVGLDFSSRLLNLAALVEPGDAP